MKNFSYIFVLLAIVLFSGCEDVIDVNLDTAEPRLVIEAFISWQKGTSGNEQKIKLSTTTGFYNAAIPTVSGADIQIVSGQGATYNFTETPGTGEYLCDNFVPVIGESYTLTVIHAGQTYTATETLKPVPVIDRVEQKNDGGFTADEIEIKVFATDDGATDDFYLLKYTPPFTAIPVFSANSDEYFQGNQISDIYSSEDFKPGQNVGIYLYGISELHYNYMSILLEIASGGGPFSTQPVNVRGNIVNTTNFDNYALGFFNLSEYDYVNYQIQ